MRIMLVNDDGYRAQGVRILAQTLIRAGHTVTICAPAAERSGASHAFSFGRPVTAAPFDEEGLTGYAISGSPADCAALGLHLLGRNADLVISGINNGTNLGGACLYSGTVGGAMEASLLGIPAIAVSIGDYDQGYRFADASEVVAGMLDWVVQNPLACGEVYNINIPNLPRAEIKGFRKAELTRTLRCNSAYVETVLSDGSTEYTAHFGGFDDSENPACDSMLLKDGWVTITPLTWNLTAAREFSLPQVIL